MYRRTESWPVWRQIARDRFLRVVPKSLLQAGKHISRRSCRCWGRKRLVSVADVASSRHHPLSATRAHDQFVSGAKNSEVRALVVLLRAKSPVMRQASSAWYAAVAVVAKQSTVVASAHVRAPFCWCNICFNWTAEDGGIGRVCKRAVFLSGGSALFAW
jgi:hypothetical protein